MMRFARARLVDLVSDGDIDTAECDLARMVIKLCDKIDRINHVLVRRGVCFRKAKP